MANMWIGYARSGHEFDVQNEINTIGATSWVARKIEAIRSGKKRWPEAKTVALLPNYQFIECSDDQWHELPKIKFLASSFFPIYRVPPSLRLYMETVDAEYDRQSARVDAGERLSEYSEGDLFEILDGPLRGNLATYRAIVENARDQFPRLKGEVQMMGRVVPVEVDPLHARKAVAL